MFKYYFKVAIRNLTRKKTYSINNILSLALGMTCGILIFMLVNYHQSFNNFHNHSDRIYRFVTESHRDMIYYSPSVPSPLGKVFREDYPFGEKIARIATYKNVLITTNDNSEIKKFKENEGIAFTESEFFDIFNFPYQQGDKSATLIEPNTAIVTESVARKLFGNASPINKTFRLDNKIDFIITAVLKDIPSNSDLQTGIYCSYSTLKQYDEWLASDDKAWNGITNVLQCFIRLQPGVSPEQVEQVLPSYVKKYRPTSKNIHHYKLQPLSDIHFSSVYGGVMPKNILLALSLIGLFIIVTACINFINLATALALSRYKEVGVRKVFGSLRGQLFRQFIFETGIITVTSLALGFVCALLILPVINEWFQTRLTLHQTGWQLGVFVVFLAFVVTLLAGSYPGLVLSSVQSVLVLKGWPLRQNRGDFNIRRALILTQFTISMILINSVIIMSNQIQYVTKSDLGFNKDAVVMLPIPDDTKTNTINTLKERFSKLSSVIQVSACRAAPLSDNNWSTSFQFDNRDENEDFAISIRSADNNYIPLFDLELVAGRNIYPSDTAREFVVNEMLIKKLNLNSSQEIIGKMLSMNGGTLQGPIVGVVRDFHDSDFHEYINPVCIASQSDDYNNYAVKIYLNDVSTTLGLLDKTWNELHPDQFFEYQFLDDQIKKYYQSITFMLSLVEIFAFIAISIACLGLFGLVAFMVTKKTKEIGIRKVLGIRDGHIVWIFAKEFLQLILLAIIFSIPITWSVMNNWLQDFAYRIEIQWWMFGMTGLLAIMIAAAIVSFKTIKAVRTNPVETLRSP